MKNNDKLLLRLEIAIMILACIVLLVSIYTYVITENKILLIAGMIIFLVNGFYALKIEQVAGYYECGKCHHRYIPTYKSVFWAMHIGRTRYMRCPHCKEKSWNKKRLTQD